MTWQTILALVIREVFTAIAGVVADYFAQRRREAEQRELGAAQQRNADNDATLQQIETINEIREASRAGGRDAAIDRLRKWQRDPQSATR